MENKSYWKCEEITPLWRLWSRGCSIWMACVPRGAKLDLPEGCKENRKRVYQTPEYEAVIVRVPKEAEEAFVTWAERNEDRCLLRGMTSFVEYVEGVWATI